MVGDLHGWRAARRVPESFAGRGLLRLHERAVRLVSFRDTESLLPEQTEELHRASYRCDHGDVRYCPDEKGAIACFKCGRLFGHLCSVSGWFRAYNPTQALRSE